MTATDQTLGVADVYSSRLNSSSFSPDGLMGMAFKSLSSYGANPVFQSLVEQKRTAESVFAFKLTSIGSELYIGGVNKKLYTGEFTYTPVTEKVRKYRTLF
jgi:cathepsin D